MSLRAREIRSRPVGHKTAGRTFQKWFTAAALGVAVATTSAFTLLAPRSAIADEEKSFMDALRKMHDAAKPFRDRGTARVRITVSKSQLQFSSIAFVSSDHTVSIKVVSYEISNLREKRNEWAVKINVDGQEKVVDITAWVNSNAPWTMNFDFLLNETRLADGTKKFSVYVVPLKLPYPLFEGFGGYDADAHRINKIMPNHPALLFDIPFKYEIGTAIDVTDPAVQKKVDKLGALAQVQENLGVKDAKKKELDKLDKETGGKHREEILQYALNAGFGEAALTAAKECGIQINQLIKLEDIAQREIILQKDVVLQGDNLEVDAETVYNHKLRVKLEQLPRVPLSGVGTALYQTCREYVCHNSVTPKFEVAGKKFGVFIEGVPSPRGGTSDILVSVPGDTKKDQKVPIDNNLIDLDKHEVIGIT